MSGKLKSGRIFSTVFWVVMAIHIIVFTILGITTSRWTLLIIFIPGVAVILGVKQIWRKYGGRQSVDSQK